jgi:serine/threonine protein kinase
MTFAEALPQGFKLHGYRIEKTLGGGGFSIVYLATNLKTEARVAIKEYLPADQARRLEDASVESISDESSSNIFRKGLKRFFDEAAALAKVNHPNIVRVTDFFRANNTVYLVMRYERGKDLRSYIKRHSGRLSEKFIRRIFPQLLLGLWELHKNNLLHLDIKPANIYLRPGGRPLLLDFGAARLVEQDSKLTGPHTLTLGFAPIEQHRHGEVGPWSDLYAIGASMWACMSGRPPPPSTERVVDDKLKPAVRTFARRYSKDLLQAVDWCLRLNQADRPQSVQELLDFLNRSWITDMQDEQPGYFDRLREKLPWNR